MWEPPPSAQKQNGRGAGTGEGPPTSRLMSLLPKAVRSLKRSELTKETHKWYQGWKEGKDGMAQDLTTEPHCQMYPCLPSVTSQTLRTPPQGNTDEEIGLRKYSLLWTQLENIMKSGSNLVKCKYTRTRLGNALFLYNPDAKEKLK